MKIVFVQMSLAFFVLTNLDSWSLLRCSKTGPPLLSSTGHLGNRIGRNGARACGAWAVGGGEGEGRGRRGRRGRKGRRGEGRRGEEGGGEEGRGGGEVVHTEAAGHLMITAGTTEDEVTEDL